MTQHVVSVSPIAAHFLLRPVREQKVIIGTALAFGAPALAMLLWYWWTGAGLAWLWVLIGVALATIGWRVGTWSANISALLHHRRAQQEAANAVHPPAS